MSWLLRSVLASFCALCAVIASAQGYGSLAQRAATVPDTELARVVRNAGKSGDVYLDRALDRLEAQPSKANADRVRSILDLYSLSETRADAKDAAAIAQAIRKEGGYRDPGVQESSNWLARALARLENLFRRPERDSPNVQIPEFIGTIIRVIVWVVLLVLVSLFAAFAYRHLRWRMGLARQAATVLEDDEPERTADEWLAMADVLEAQGEFRRAVRCLYLACLLRFDEARVARFDRGQTNWEHLDRIERSPRRPEGLDFRPATRAFDIVWYGKVVRGREDVDLFREHYRQVRDMTTAVPA